MNKTINDKYNAFVDRLKAVTEKAINAGLEKMNPEVQIKCKVATANVLALQRTLPLMMLQELKTGTCDSCRSILEEVNTAVKEFEQAVDEQIVSAKAVALN